METKHKTQEKQELEQNEVPQVLGFIKHYGKHVGIGTAAVIVAVLLITGIGERKATKEADAQSMLSEARTPEQLQAVLDQFGSTSAAPSALLNLAKTTFNNGNYFEARDHYNQFLKKYSSHEMVPVAEFGLASCSEADGDFTQAIAQFKAFIDADEAGFLKPMAIISMARSMKLAGQTGEARIVLENFLVGNAGSPWAAQAEGVLMQLED